MSSPFHKNPLQTICFRACRRRAAVTTLVSAVAARRPSWRLPPFGDMPTIGNQLEELNYAVATLAKSNDEHERRLRSMELGLVAAPAAAEDIGDNLMQASQIEEQTAPADRAQADAEAWAKRRQAAMAKAAERRAAEYMPDQIGWRWRELPSVKGESMSFGVTHSVPKLPQPPALSAPTTTRKRIKGTASYTEKAPLLLTPLAGGPSSGKALTRNSPRHVLRLAPSPRSVRNLARPSAVPSPSAPPPNGSPRPATHHLQMPRHLAPLTTIASEPRAQTSEPQPRGGDRLSRRRLSSTQLYVPPSPRQVFSHEVPCSKHAYSTNRSQLSDRGVFMTTSPRELNADRQSKALLCSVHQYSTIDSPAVSSFHYYDNSTIPNSPIYFNRTHLLYPSVAGPYPISTPIGIIESSNTVHS